MLSAVLTLAIATAYHNSFSVPFLLDDAQAITKNPSIKRLWPISDVLSPPSRLTTGGRPLLNLTFAVNYAIGGTAVEGFHAFNLIIHILAAATLFGIVRRTLALPQFRLMIETHGPWIALATALLWALHPIQTESVTYISQRAEALMGMWYLLTLYCFVRGATSVRPGGWHALSITACAMGMATKEVMITAPLMVLLYSRTFLTGSFRGALQQHWRLYLGLGVTWLIVAIALASSPLRDRAVGNLGGFTPSTYAFTESRVVIRYLQLALWPNPLVFDYGPEPIARGAGEVVPQLLLIGLLLAGIFFALRRGLAVGFLGSWFLVILAPTSSIVPVASQPMAESRLYLPLAAVALLATLGAYKIAKRAYILIALGIALLLGGLTVRRNMDYQSALAIWSDTVAKCAKNPRAHVQLGDALMRIPGGLKHAVAQYESALAIESGFEGTHNNLGIALAMIPTRVPEAIGHFETALRLNPDSAEAHNNLVKLLADIPDRQSEVIPHCEAALRLAPDSAETHRNVANALAKIPDHLTEAIAHYEIALKLNPDDADAHHDLGDALTKVHGRASDAVIHYEAALRLQSDSAETHNNLAALLVATPGRIAEAITHYEEAVRLEPNSAEMHYNLGDALLRVSGRLTEAIAHYEAGLRLKPDYLVHYSVGAALLKTADRTHEAKAHFDAALRIRPDFEPARQVLRQLEALQPER